MPVPAGLRTPGLLRIVTAGAFAALVAGSAHAAPAFDDEGRLIVPADTHAWPTVGVTVAMQYEGDGGNTFNSVRMDPASYAAYLDTGAFPVGTMFDLEIRRPATEAEPARGGTFQGKVLGRSMHVKDERAGPGTWTFYAYPVDGDRGTAIERSEACYSCHDEHAPEDTVFTQFYPILAERRRPAED